MSTTQRLMALLPSSLPAEISTAWRLAALVLVALTVAKGLGSVPYLGPLVLSLAAFLQLYLPMRRCEAYDLPNTAIGLSTEAWRTDLRNVFWLSALILPAYAGIVHLYLTGGQALLARWLPSLAVWVPHAAWSPTLPLGGLAWGAWGLAAMQRIAIHLLGVALPEETFYRGYLQPQLEQHWPPRRRLAGTLLGRGAVVAAALFALGHFLGEWSPARLAPFFPALLFAWLRNRSQTVLGAVTFHALCNVFSELWFGCYRIVP